jgi:hypothetical protein
MNTKDVSTPEEALALIDSLADTNHVNATLTSDGIYRVGWVPKKQYTTHDGKEFTDEVWMTEHGELIVVQDLTPDHAKNIIRMVLRNEQTRYRNLEQLEAAIDSAIVAADTDTPPVLH